MAIGELTLDESNEDNMKLLMGLDYAMCNFEPVFMADLFKEPLPEEKSIEEKFVKIKPEVKMGKHYKDFSDNIYVLSNNHSNYRAVNIVNGTIWNMCIHSEEDATRGLTKIEGTVEFKETKIYVKSAVDIMKILEDDGYEVDSDGYWHHKNKLTFAPGMFMYCGHEIVKNPSGSLTSFRLGGSKFLPEWTEKR